MLDYKMLHIANVKDERLLLFLEGHKQKKVKVRTDIKIQRVQNLL